jgi:hypothetical protein
LRNLPYAAKDSFSEILSQKMVSWRAFWNPLDASQDFDAGV